MKFGTSGLRGLVTDLEGRASALYAQAFAQHLIETGGTRRGDRILVGRDLRPSSPSISATCIGALARAGLVPLDCGAVPTPALAFYGLHIGAPSLMITGSHIPADRNGIKFYRADGEIDKHDEARIAAIAGQLATGQVDETPGTAPIVEADVRQLFAARIASILPAGALTGLRIGIYEHSTVARELMAEMLGHFGADVVKLGHSERFIPVDTEAVSANTISMLESWARDYRLDAIVSADGDGDRPLVADETGAPVRGDLLGLITALFLRAKTIVTPVTSNSGIEAVADFDVIRTRVGSPFVISGMQDALAGGRNAVMGFEANGGLLTASAFTVAGRILSPLPTRDSFLPVLAALHRMVSDGEPLSAIASNFHLPVAMADRLENFPVEASAALMAYLLDGRQKMESFVAPLGTLRQFSDIDGLRLTLTDDRILHLRPSGNAPEMRCYVEAGDEDTAGRLLEDSLQLIRTWALQKTGHA